MRIVEKKICRGFLEGFDNLGTTTCGSAVTVMATTRTRFLLNGLETGAIGVITVFARTGRFRRFNTAENRD